MEKKSRNSMKQYSSKPMIEMRESKTEMGHANPFKPEKEPWLKKSYDHRSPDIPSKK